MKECCNQLYPGRQVLLPFQKGVIMNCNALPLLLNDLKKKYNVEYILTSRLNQGGGAKIIYAELEEYTDDQLELDEITHLAVYMAFRPRGKKALGGGGLLLNYLKKKYNVEYILTSRLNQDYLENMFGMIRASGSQHTHPTALEFTHRLRKYLLVFLTRFLKVDHENRPFLINPIDQESIYVFSDSPHNELHKITKEKDLNIAYKLTDAHLNVVGFQRQKVELADQLLKNSCDCIKESWDLMINWCCSNDWFDVFNSREPKKYSRERT
uniref:Transposable element P transposase-like RNase H C-terminal domain-containing protein n=1 Tax=Megaselia scalaris TaxID=36166 RepID=T1GKL7_MEGSC